MSDMRGRKRDREDEERGIPHPSPRHLHGRLLGAGSAFHQDPTSNAAILDRLAQNAGDTHALSHHLLNHSLVTTPQLQPMSGGSLLGGAAMAPFANPYGFAVASDSEALMRQVSNPLQFQAGVPSGVPPAMLLQVLALQNQALAQSLRATQAIAAANGGIPPNGSNRVNASVTPGSVSRPHRDPAPDPAPTLTPQGPSSVRSSMPSDAPKLAVSGRHPLEMYTTQDEGRLTPYQCLARKHLEYFEADHAKVAEGAQGRNKAIVLGQVGIRCIHCSHLKRRQKAPAAAFYPSKLTGIYQSSQNIINSHLAKDCDHVPKGVREQLLTLGNRKSAPGGGRAYWSGEAMRVGVYEDEHGLRFVSQGAAPAASVPSPVPVPVPAPSPARLEP